MPFNILKGIRVKGKRRLRLPTMIVSAVFLLVLAGCVTVQERTDPGSVTSEGDGDPVSVIRSDGVELTLDFTPNRIVSLSAGATETLFAIGAGDQLVAVEMFSDYPQEALELPRIDAFQPDPEAILAHDPDLVFVIYNADGIVSILDDLGLNVYYLEAPRSLDELFDQIEEMGAITRNHDQAVALADELRQRVESVNRQIGDLLEPPRIYHELDSTFFTVSPDSFIGDVYQSLGAENIAAGAVGDYPQLSEEIIIERNPDVIIVPSYGDNPESLVEQIRERPGWEEINAVLENRIFTVDGDMISRPGPRIVDVFEELARLLYPEIIGASHVPDHTAGVTGIDSRHCAA